MAQPDRPRDSAAADSDESGIGGVDRRTLLKGGGAVAGLGTLGALYLSLSDSDDSPASENGPSTDGQLPSGEPVDIDSRTEELQTIVDPNRTRELAEELAWITNQWVPQIGLEGAVRSQFVSHEFWDWQLSSVAPEYNAEQPWSYLARTQHLRHDTGDRDQFFELPTFESMEQTHLNFGHSPSESGHLFLARVLFDEPALYAPATDEYFPAVFENWEVTSTSATVTIRDDLSWNRRDDPFTTADVTDHYLLKGGLGQLPGRLIDDWTIHDDHSLTVTYPERRPEAARAALLGTAQNWTGFTTHPHHHGEFVERLRDGETGESVRTDLLDDEIDAETAIREGLSFGPVEIDRTTERRIECPFVEDYPFGEIGEYEGRPAEPNFAGFAVTDHGPEPINYQQAAVSDAIHGFPGSAPETVRDTLADHWDSYGYPALRYAALHFSPNARPWGADSARGRAVRQALAHVYDPSVFVEILGSSSARTPRPNSVTGLTERGQNRWLADIVPELTSYGDPSTGWSQPDRAAELLRAAGYERDDGWVDGDGDSLSADILFPANDRSRVPAYENIGSQFRGFGIDVRMVPITEGRLVEERFSSHDFELAIAPSGHEHPWEAYPNTLGDVTRPDGFRYNNGLSEVSVPWPPTWRV